MSVCAKCTICPDVCVCVRRGRQFAQSFFWRHSVEQSLSLHKASRKWSPQHTPAQRHPINPFPPPCVVRWSVQWVTELIVSLWSNIPCRVNTYWWDIMLFVEMTLCYSAGNEKTFFFIASCLSPDSSKSWPLNYDWLIWDILTLENAKSVLHELNFFISDN